MAAKDKDKAAATTEEVLNRRVVTESGDPGDAAEDDVDVNRIREVLGSHDVTGGILRLERKGPLDQTHQYVTKMPVEKFDIDYIKSYFGGGDYIAKTWKANGQIYKRFEFSIDHRIKGKLDEQDIKELGSSKGDMAKTVELLTKLNTPQDNTGMFVKMMEMQSSKSDQMMALMMTMMTKSQETQSATMAAMFNAMAAMAKQQPMAQVATGSVSDSFTTSFVPVLVKLIETSASPAKNNLLETLEIVRALKEMNGDGGQAKEEDMFDKLLKVAGPVAGMLMNRGQQQMSVPVSSLAKPIEGGLHQPPTSVNTGMPINGRPTGGAGVGVPLDPVVKMFIERLFQAAVKKSDPGAYATLIIDTLPDDQLIGLVQILTQADWSVKLFGDEPRFAQNQIWFNDLRETILVYAQPDAVSSTGEDQAKQFSGETDGSAAGVGGSFGSQASG